ncbi:GMC oxidoreductase [Mycobacterium sp. pW049]|uniref:GMC oxidoreductase n=1 Tax=[Mycobacterium] bulgaricum TaxID=3238985 RepID=UPI00351AF8CA
MTIRCSEAGWARDIYGLYRYGGWHFELSKAQFPRGVTMKLLLDGRHFMAGEDHHLDSTVNHHFQDPEIAFEGAPAHRITLPYGNFRGEYSRQEQEIAAGNVNSDIAYDVIVVGSGMGGGILADQLADRGASVLILEAGAIAVPTHMHNLPGAWENLAERNQIIHFENERDSQFLFGVQLNLGGRSVFWSGLIPRMRDWELAYWPNEIATYLRTDGYSAAEALMRKQRNLGPYQRSVVEHLAQHLPDYSVSDQPRSKHQPHLTPDGSALGDIIDTSTGTFSTAELLIDSLSHPGRSGRDNLTINLLHRVVRIESLGEESALIHCHDLAGNVERSYRARYVVMCAGSVESPRIALQSNLRDPNGKIGRGLSDHPAYFSHGGSDYGYPIPRFRADGTPHPFGDPGVAAKILIQHNSASSREHAFNAEVLINGWYWDFRHADDDVRRARLDETALARVKFQFNFLTELDDRNYIALRGDNRPLGIHVNANEAGRQFHEECKQLRNRILTALDVENPDPNRDLGYGNQGTPHHAGGSLRISGDGSGVVDANLKFEAYPNLYACDVSVFPVIPCANPSLTLGALSLRLADHLAGRLNLP